MNSLSSVRDSVGIMKWEREGNLPTKVYYIISLTFCKQKKGRAYALPFH